MFTAFCARTGCDWEAAATYVDPLRALAAVDRHLLIGHGKRPGDPAHTEFADMISVPGEGDEAWESRTYVMATADELNAALASGYRVA